MSNTIQYGLLTKKKTMLFVGFDGDFNGKIINFPYSDADLGYKIINNPFKAITWLQEQVAEKEIYNPPYAIFFRAGYLGEKDSHFFQAIRSNPDLKFVPLIALAEMDQKHLAKDFVSKGIDDCYTFPTNWSDLEARVAFLNQYKPRLQETTLSTEAFSYKIPFAKRAIDVIGASILILATLPIWLPVALGILIESGYPFIYRSKRAGTGYQVFDFLKFRSMWKDADQRLKQHMDKNQYAEGQKSIFVKLKNDPRITTFGRFIRKYSIDELPQLLNILKGDMSLVGNRPLPLYEAEQLTRDEWSGRFLAPAGLTGLWQVTKRGSDDMSMEERIALDLEYAQNWSVWTDINILFKTLTAFVQKENV